MGDGEASAERSNAMAFRSHGQEPASAPLALREDGGDA